MAASLGSPAKSSFEIRHPDVPLRGRLGISDPPIVACDAQAQTDPIAAHRNERTRSFRRKIAERDSAGVADQKPVAVGEPDRNFPYPAGTRFDTFVSVGGQRVNDDGIERAIEVRGDTRNRMSIGGPGK